MGRDGLLATIEERLGAGGGVALHGPAGIGKTAILDAVSARAAVRGELVLRVRPVRTERSVAYGSFADLVSQLPDLPLRSGARRLVLPVLLARCARARPVLLVLDDCQWLDAASAELIGSAMRRRSGPRVRVLAAQRRPDPAGQHRAARLCPAPVLELAVPPMAADDLTVLLEARGLPCRTASRMHETSAGNPFLALALGGAVAPGPAWRPAPIPEAAREVMREQLAALPADIRRTLLTAALATGPTTTVLIRAGREDAVRDLRLAAAAGVITLDGDAIRFVPPLLAQVIAEDACAADRSAVHASLAAGAVDPVQALRHRALRTGRPDATVARSLALAADGYSGRAAAELYLLAADRCPHTLAGLRLDWLVAAARSALTGGAPGLAGRAAEAVIAADAPAGHRVKAGSA